MLAFGQKVVHSKEIFFFLALFLSLCFGIFLSHQRLTDPFLYYDVAFVKSLEGKVHLDFPAQGPYASLSLVPGRIVLLVQLANMMGVSPEALQFLPLGSVLISISLFLAAYRLLKSPLVACLVTLYLTINLSHATAFYSVFAYAFALPLYFGLLAIFQHLAEKQRVPEILLILLLFLGVNLIHYTISAWLILFLLGANMVIWAQKSLPHLPKPIRSSPTYYLVIALIVIFFTYNNAFYTSYLPIFGPQALINAARNFLSYISLSGEQGNISTYQFVRPRSVGVVSSLTLLVILLPVLFGVLRDAYLLYRRSLAGRNVINAPTLAGIFLTGLVDSGLYSLRGSISTKAFSILFPLLTLDYVRRLDKKYLYYGMAAFLFAASVAKIWIFYANAYLIGSGEVNTTVEEVELSAGWLRDHTAEPKPYLLADMQLYGKYLLVLAREQVQPILMTFDEQRYADVIGETSQSFDPQPDLIAIDRNSAQPVTGFVWGRFTPLKDYSDRIRMNQDLNLVYDDGAVWFLRLVGDW